MNAQKENEYLAQRNKGERREAYENLRAAVHKKKENDGVNAVLKFLNVKGRVDPNLSLDEQLEYIEEKYFIKSRRVELEADWHRIAALPMLAETANGERLAVLPNTVGGCACVKDGKSVKVTRKNTDIFKKDAICFYKTMTNESVGERGFASFLLGCTSVRDKVTAITASALAILAGMIIPWANSFIFSNIVPEGDIPAMFSAAALIIAAVSAAALMRLFRSLSLTNAMTRVGTYVQSALFARLLNIVPGFFRDVKSGKLSQLITDFSDMSKIISVRSVSACIALVLSLLYLIQIRIYAPAMFGWVVLVTIILAAMITAESVMSARWQKRYSASLSDMSAFAHEIFSGMERVKLGGAESRMYRRWSEKYRDTAIRGDKPFLLRYSESFYKLLTVVSTALIFLLGLNTLASDYIAFYAAYGAYIAAVSGSAAIIDTIGRFRSSYALISGVLTAECEEYGSKLKPKELKGDIDISDVYFRYSKDSPYVINGLSAHIKSGESIGIVGASGCGKSTLVRLLLGFNAPDEGSIYIDGFDMRELDLKSCRRKIGTVLQDCGLIAGDIFSNITMTKSDASEDEVKAAVAAAGLSEDTAEMPMGLYTPIDPENHTFSGGQKQRILIARALISNPSILILDEATSALDGITQAGIIENINKLDCTKIIVAHRLTTIEKCDRIFVMDKGTIAAEGTYDELKEKNELFKKFAKRQLPI